MKKHILFASICSCMLLAGCSSNTSKPNATIAELTLNKSNAHIIFFREGNFVGGGRNIDVLEYDSKSFKPTKNSVIIGSGDKAVFSVPPGKNYFFVRSPGPMIGVAPKYALELDVSPGQTKMVNLGFTRSTVFVPAVVKESRLNMVSKFEKMTCSPENIKRYLFNESSVDISEPEPVDPDVKFYESDMFYRIRCLKGNVTYAKDIQNPADVKEIDKLKNLELGKVDFNDYQVDISENAPSYIKRFNDIEYSQEPVLDIIKDALDSDVNKFDGFDVIVKSSGDLIESNSFNDFTTAANEKLGKYKASNKNNVNVLINVYKIDYGSQSGRYFTTGFTDNKDDVGVLGVNVVYTDKVSGKEIGVINVSSIIAAGAFGGINTMSEDTVSLIKKYTEATFIKN